MISCFNFNNKYQIIINNSEENYSLFTLPLEVRIRIYHFLPDNYKLKLAKIIRLDHRGLHDASLLANEALACKTLFHSFYTSLQNQHPFLNWFQNLSPYSKLALTIHKKFSKKAKQKILKTSFLLRNSIKILNLSIPSLKSKDLKMLREYPSLHSLFLHSCKKLKEGWTFYLPSNLTHLDAFDADVSDACVQDLPPTLIHFICRGAYLTDEAVPHLPRGLKVLYLKGNIMITAQGIKDLPPSLVSLFLPYNENLTDGCMKSLPHSLTRLFLSPQTGLTQKCVKNLPPHLSKMIPNFLPLPSRTD